VIALCWVCAVGRVATAYAATEMPPPEVRWTAPAECPSDAFTDALDRLLGGSSVATPIRVEATVERTPDGWSIRTDFDAGPDRAGQRTFQAPSCRTVTQAAALAIALAVDPGVLDRFVPMADATPVVPVAPEVPELPEPAASTPAPSEPPLPLGPIEAARPTVAPGSDARREPWSRWRGLVGVAGSVDGGALPGPGLGVTATVGVLHRGFRGELVGARRFATQRAAEADPQVGGSFTQWWLGARGCGVPRLGRVELPLCAGLEGGRTVGRGIGLPAPHTSVQPWWAGLVDAGLAWPVRPWLALTARATLAVPLVRQDFFIAGLGVVQRVGPVQGRGTLGVELRWP
jgi:hypothetical protein